MSAKEDVTKFLYTSDQKLVDKKEILQRGDWLLKWSPSHSSHNQSGFELYTPPEFGPDAEKLPMGGTVLAAMYFMLEHGDESFAAEIIARANKLAEQIGEGNATQKYTLN